MTKQILISLAIALVSFIVLKEVVFVCGCAYDIAEDQNGNPIYDENGSLVVRNINQIEKHQKENTVNSIIGAMVIVLLYHASRIVIKKLKRSHNKSIDLT